MLTKTDFIILPISYLDEQYARYVNDEIQLKASDNGFHQYFDDDDNWLGYLGESVVTRWLQSLGINFEHTVCIGRPDNCDFKIAGKCIDLKTSPLISNRLGVVWQPYVFVNANQIAHTNVDAYWFAKVDIRNKLLYLIGQETAAKIRKSKICNAYKHPCIRKLYKHLHPILTDGEVKLP